MNNSNISPKKIITFPVRKLESDAVHIWEAPILVSDERAKGLINLLSPDERNRAEQFRFKVDRNKFIAAKSFLRTTLGYYLQMPPKDLEFLSSPYGKPLLVSRNGKPQYAFNLSHSNNLVLMAISSGVELGIDVEYVQPIFETDQIVSRYFGENEIELYLKAPEVDRKDLFFWLWTRKEAFIKAIGKGLSLPLNEFDISNLLDGNKLEFKDNNGVASSWYFYTLDTSAGYKAALVVKSRDVNVSYSTTQLQMSN